MCAYLLRMAIVRFFRTQVAQECVKAPVERVVILGEHSQIPLADLISQIQSNVCLAVPQKRVPVFFLVYL